MRTREKKNVRFLWRWYKSECALFACDEAGEGAFIKTCSLCTGRLSIYYEKDQSGGFSCIFEWQRSSSSSTVSRVIRKYTDANMAYFALCQAAERDHSLYILFSTQVAGAPLVTLVWLKTSAKCLEISDFFFVPDKGSFQSSVFGFSKVIKEPAVSGKWQAITRRQKLWVLRLFPLALFQALKRPRCQYDVKKSMHVGCQYRNFKLCLLSVLMSNHTSIGYFNACFKI